MSKLIEDLKNGHKILLELVDMVNKEGVTSQTGKSHLIQIKNIVLEHLNIEDDELYPQLKEKAESDERLKSLLDTFAQEMSTITTAFGAFYDELETETDGFAISKSFGRLMTGLKTRIRREENILFPEYDKIAK